MRWRDRLFWPVIWLIYLGPVAYFFAEMALRSYLASKYDCEWSAAGVTPCIIAGSDWGAFMHAGWAAGYAVVFFIIPWLAIGGLFVIFLKLADNWTDR